MKGWLVLLLATISACAGTKGMPALEPETHSAYQLGPGDVLQIIVFGESDLSASYPISASGDLDVPLVGSVPATGLTVSQLQQQLAQRLDQKAVKSPNVTVSVTTYRPFFILGAVKNPGAYPYIPNMTVLTAVATAGGFTDRAARGEISVIRQQNGKFAAEAKAMRDSRVMPGDVVNIFERHF